MISDLYFRRRVQIRRQVHLHSRGQAVYFDGEPASADANAHAANEQSNEHERQHEPAAVAANDAWPSNAPNERRSKLVHANDDGECSSVPSAERDARVDSSAAATDAKHDDDGEPKPKHDGRDGVGKQWRTTARSVEQEFSWRREGAFDRRGLVRRGWDRVKLG